MLETPFYISHFRYKSKYYLSSSLTILSVEWMRRQPQGRQTKQKARQEAYYKLEKSTKPRVKDPKLEIEEDGQRRMGGNILKVSQIP